MRNFSELNGNEELEQLLDVLCNSTEYEDIILRRQEKNVLNALNKNKHNRAIRFPKEGKVKDNATKVSILLQATLDCLQISDVSLSMEALKVSNVAKRISKCLVQYLWSMNDKPKTFTLLKNAIILMKSVNCGVWENSQYLSKQFDGIGLAYATCLVNSGITSLKAILDVNSRELELIVNKQPPFGNHLKKLAESVPRYKIEIEDLDQDSRRRKARISISMQNSIDANKSGIAYLLVGKPETSQLLCKAKIFERQLSLRPFQHTLYLYEDSELHLISDSFCGNDIRLSLSANPSTMKTDVNSFLSESIVQEMDSDWPCEVSQHFDHRKKPSNLKMQSFKPAGAIFPKPLNFESLKNLSAKPNVSKFSSSNLSFGSHAPTNKKAIDNEGLDQSIMNKSMRQKSISEYFPEKKILPPKKNARDDAPSSEMKTPDAKENISNELNILKRKAETDKITNPLESDLKIIKTGNLTDKRFDSHPFSQGDNNANPFRRCSENDQVARPVFSREVMAQLDEARRLFRNNSQDVNNESCINPGPKKPKALRRLLALLQDF
jgi:hypothetical protein